MALYHKYRPQKFSDISGQEHIVQTLTNQIKRDTVSHAYLFSGPRGIGKTTVARLLAKALNCEKRRQGSDEICDSCSSCEEIRRAKALDVIEIDAASHTGVENIRQNVIENAQFRPTKSRWKIFIVDEVHMLSTSAFNALLKTMEEPPEHIIFILATTELHKVPATVVSRCQRFDFSRIPFETMKKTVQSVARGEGISVDKDVVEKIIQKSDGCLRDAMSLLDQLMAIGEANITRENAVFVLPLTHTETSIAFVRCLVEGNLEKGLDLLDSLAGESADFANLTYDMLTMLRYMMITKVQKNASSFSADFSAHTEKELVQLSQDIDLSSIVQLIDLVLKRKVEIRTAPIAQLPLELLLVEWYNHALNEISPTSTSPLITQQKAVIQEETFEGENKKTRHKTYTNKSIQQIKEKVKQMVSSVPACTLEDVQAGWNSCLEELEKISPSLVFILRMSEITAVHGNTVQLSVRYGFHKEKLTERPNRHAIETELSKRLRQEIDISIAVDDQKHIGVTETPPELAVLAAQLGGEIIQ